MNTGLTIYKNDLDNILLDADNIFWAVVKKEKNSNLFIPHRLLSLYERLKDKLDREFNNFRFSKQLSAVYIDPTDRCNANCPYCYIPAKKRLNGRSMNEAELTFILEKIARYFSSVNKKNPERKPVIVFHASEPLLVKEIIFRGIKRFSKLFNFGLQTNALLLEREDAEFLERYRVGVGISLDASVSGVNNRLRPSLGFAGNFKKAVRAIEWFDGYEGLNVITTITKFNVRGLPDMVRFLHTKRVPCVLFNPIRLTQKSSHNLKPNERLLTRYFIKAVDKAIELSKTSNHRIIIGNFANIILGIVAPQGRRLMCDISPCGGGRCFLTITASGNMIPCGEFIGLKGFIGGNIFETGIQEAMESLSFKRLRGRIVEKISKCKLCIFRNICGAPCPAELHSLGNMFGLSVFCEFYQEIIKYAFRLIAKREERYCLREDGLRNLKYEYNLNPTSLGR